MREVRHPPPGDHAPAVCLDEEDGPFDLHVAPLGEPPTDVLLDHNAAGPQSLRPNLLQVRHLTSPEEDLCLTELVLVPVLQRQHAE